jgi:uncharacterized membrane protein YkvA (DUF1232 family)
MSDSKGLTREEVYAIENAYAESLDEVDREDANHVLAKEAKARKKVEPLLSEDRWVHFGRQILLLYGMLKAWWRDEFALPWKSAAAITAALLYFLNPFDIVPDFIPVVGYLDDAVVVGACLKLIQVDLRAYAASKGLDLTDYGL